MKKKKIKRESQGIKKSKKMKGKKTTGRGSSVRRKVNSDSLANFARESVIKEKTPKSKKKTRRTDSIYRGGPKRVIAPQSKKEDSRKQLPVHLLSPLRSIKRTTNVSSEDQHVPPTISQPDFDQDTGLEDPFEFSVYDNESGGSGVVIEGVYDDAIKFRKVVNALVELKEKGHVENFSGENVLTYLKHHCEFLPI